MLKTLWITEKPSAAQALQEGICAALGVTSKRCKGFFELSNGDVVAWLHGHLIEPVFIPEALKKVSRAEYFNHLPFRFENFEYGPKPERDRDGKIVLRGGKPVPNAQYLLVSGFIKKAARIVNAGDTDREGQLIVDELLIDAGVSPEGRNKPVLRLPLVSNRLDDVKQEVLALKESNGDPKWVNKRLAAMARAFCDQMVGANGSMAYQAATGIPNMSVGRVQTPVVAIVVDRERAIRAFKPVAFFTPVVTLADGTELTFYKRDGAEGQPGFDEKGRIIDENIARQMVGLISAGLKGKVTAAKQVHSSEAPPLPFSASVLASTVSKRIGITPKEATKAAQALYDKKVISYLGTDCQFLPTSMLNDVRDVMASLSRAYPRVAGAADLSLRSKAWNDAKVDEHHAIVPMGPLPAGATPEEKAVFDAVARRFMAQFYPAAEHVTHRLEAMFGADAFKATRKETVKMGWREVEGQMEQGGPGADSDAEADADADAGQGDKKPTQRGGRT